MTDVNIDGIVTWLSNWFQDKLISGTNIKTVNNQSLLGSGNISVSGGGGITIDDVYPVGSIYMSVNSTSPQTLFGGTWEQIKDTFLLASGTSYTNGATGGSADATLVRHNHYPSGENYFVVNDTDGASNYRVGSATSGRWVDGQTNSGTFHHTQATNFVGSDGTGKNMPPYLAVNVWKRTA